MRLTILIRRYIIGVGVVLIEIGHAGFTRRDEGSSIGRAADAL